MWRTDGTAEGTRQVKSFCGPTLPCDPNTASYGLMAYQGRLLFGAGNGMDYEPWISDGTTTGTYELIDLCGGNTIGSTPRHFHEHHGEIYFETNCGPGTGPAVFKTNGTAEGTVLLASYPLTVARTGFVDLRDLLFFTAGGQLWRTDGTAQGTYGVADFGQMGRVSAMGDQLIFPATRTFSGRATLWVSDGTGAGTRELPEGRFGWGWAVYPFGNRALFAGDANPPELLSSAEPWITNGTEEGTRLLQEINPGPVGSFPETFTAAGSKIFFVATEPTHATELWALPRSVLTGPRCFDEPTKLCLQDGRFEVTVRWRNQHGGGMEGVGRASSWSRESGTFTFFDAANTELVAKVLDGSGVNGSFWFFYGALSDVEYWIEVKDWQTGLVRTYHNPPGEICGGAYTGDFPAPASAASSSAPATAQVPQIVAAAGAGSCVPSSKRLCLLDGRVEVEVLWRNQHGGGVEGEATVLSASAKSGFFSFFQPGNIELVVKALDGTAVNGKIWFFYGALSDVEYLITARDTVTGAVQAYHNPPGRICGVGDTGAL